MGSRPRRKNRYRTNSVNLSNRTSKKTVTISTSERVKQFIISNLPLLAKWIISWIIDFFHNHL